VDTAPEPENVGKTIMCGAKKTDDNKWQGSIINLDNGHSFFLDGGLRRLLARKIDRPQSWK
jgi:uncharacterized protein (DUF2147 family)